MSDTAIDLDRALIETEEWAVEHFVGDPPHLTRRRNNAWAICQALREWRSAGGPAGARERAIDAAHNFFADEGRGLFVSRPFLTALVDAVLSALGASAAGPEEPRHG